MTDYLRVMLMPMGCGGKPRQIRIQAEMSKCGRFALHRDVDGSNGWTITHVPSGMFIQRGLTSAHAADLFIDLRESSLNWNFTDAAAMPNEVRAYGRIARRKFPDMFASAPRRRA